MLLRSDVVVALDRVQMMCRRAAATHDDVAALLTEDTDTPARWTGLLADLADERRRYADDLDRHIRQLGDQPSDPDPDRELIDKVVRHVRSVVTFDERVTLTQKCESIEEELAGDVSAALKLDDELPGPAKAVLAHAARSVADARRQLEQMRRAAVA